MKSFKTTDGKTYEFTYEKGSAPDTLTDISNADFTKVTWKMTEKKVDSITSTDTSEPTHIEIERNFQKTEDEDNGTFTFTETKEDGKTYRGLKKVAGDGNVYRSEDGSVTITVSPRRSALMRSRPLWKARAIRMSRSIRRHCQL